MTSITPVNEQDFAAPTKAQRAALVAREFESMFASTMLRAMRKTVGENPLVPQGMGEKMYTEMLDDQYAKMLAEHGNFGLAEKILKELGESESALEDLMALKTQSRGTAAALSGYSYTRPESSRNLYDNVQKWDNLINEASSTYNLDRDLIAAVIARESSGNPTAVSRAGAKGLMQLMDGTAADMGTRDAFDPAQNVRGGAKYLRAMLDRFGGDIRKALASYNAGPSAVERHKGIPPYRETQDYVEAVLNLKNSFARLRSQSNNVETP